MGFYELASATNNERMGFVDVVDLIVIDAVDVFFVGACQNAGQGERARFRFVLWTKEGERARSLSPFRAGEIFRSSSHAG